ncbi:MAG: malate synthase G, partial [Pseudomonadota bacterium]
MANYVVRANLQIDADLCDFVENKACTDLDITPEGFWQSLYEALQVLAEKNHALLATRQALQEKLDAFYQENRDGDLSPSAQEAFYREIGYLVPAGEDFTIDVQNVDPEVATIAGPQLIVPIKNARYALNAANARFGSLFDALYGSDAIANESPPQSGYDPVRGQAVFDRAYRLLDENFAFAQGSHTQCSAYQLQDGALVGIIAGQPTPLIAPHQFCGYNEKDGDLCDILLRHHNLHINIIINRDSIIGKQSAAGICDILVESAITTIQDFEDSVAAVDAADKCEVYANWLGLMKGDLQAQFTKAGKTLTRALQPDRTYKTPHGS